MSQPLILNLRSQRKGQDPVGCNIWRTVQDVQQVPADKVAILISDMWDTHQYTGAARRVDAMAPRMNQALCAARRKGVHIIHAPNDCMDFYAGHPARIRMSASPTYLPPNPRPLEGAPPPFGPESEQSDTPGMDLPYSATQVPWTRQHAAIEIDQDRDGIAVSGLEVYSYLRHHGIERYLIMGVHTNCCVMHRTFGIVQMTRWGVPTALVRDLTDAIYDPYRPPYVSHDDGTRLVVEYIEKFWCPTIESSDLTA